MSQTQVVRGTKTSVKSDGHKTRVRYHNTDVVEFTPDTIVLRSGGWETVTTKLRMNQASNQYGLGYGVYQSDFQWWVDYKGETVPFVDGMELSRE